VAVVGAVMVCLVLDRPVVVVVVVSLPWMTLL
jgi:hypothetical protein